MSWRRTEARSWPDFARWQVVSGSLARVFPRQLEGDCRRPKMMPPGIEAGGEAGGSEGEGGMGDDGGQGFEVGLLESVGWRACALWPLYVLLSVLLLAALID